MQYDKDTKSKISLVYYIKNLAFKNYDTPCWDHLNTSFSTSD